MGRWMDERMDRWIKKVDGWMDAWMEKDGLIKEWMNERKDSCMN